MADQSRGYAHHRGIPYGYAVAWLLMSRPSVAAAVVARGRLQDACGVGVDQGGVVLAVAEWPARCKIKPERDVVSLP